jgi:cbb3-type cytochrome c oxidase subunit III
MAGGGRGAGDGRIIPGPDRRRLYNNRSVGDLVFCERTIVITPRKWTRSFSALVVGSAIAMLLPLTVRSMVFAQAPDAPDPADIAAGMRIFRSKADCQTCHGWAGDGRKMDTQMPDGANLRTTRLNRNGIITAIKCGRPGKEMPAFDRLAYSDGRCNNLKTADLQRLGLELTEPASTLQPREIEQVTDFLFAKVIGKGPMNRAACIEFWGSEVEACKEFPQ